MPSFPHPGSVTICEINRDLITAESLSDDRAKDTYAKLLGMVFSPVPFQSNQVVPPSSEQDTEQQGKGLISAFQGILNDSLTRIFHPNHVNLLPEVDLHGVSWHQHKHIIAFISGPSQVMVRDYEDSEGKDPCILTNESQRDVKVLEWRPNSGRVLSVACKGGICIWAASFPGNAASVRPGAVSFLGTNSRGSGVRYILVDFLRSPNDEQISALSWSPDGRYLASASYESSSFTVWDVAQGVGTPIRRGLGGISMMKWSPTGDYFFAAKFDGTFYLWETNTWTSEPWSSTSGFVTGAAWDPDGHMILIAFSGSSMLGSVHFASKPPSLDAHLLPVDLPEIMSLTGSQGIEKIAWDASGERLAVSYKGGDELYRGLIAIYDARRAPLLSASLIGFIRGPGENPKPMAFSFHDKFKQGPLLSVCWSSGFCCTYPLIFRSHVLP
ncbi:aladin isoform X1 [Quercus robur]|uniref:aladin isoform X1 n=1 Tax=Quercus robur TaxID=38942 RepID=UPI002163DF6E|nr:aladin isoform X1 [Quercus robur]